MLKLMKVEYLVKNRLWFLNYYYIIDCHQTSLNKPVAWNSIQNLKYILSEYRNYSDGFYVPHLSGQTDNPNNYIAWLGPEKLLLWAPHVLSNLIQLRDNIRGPASLKSTRRKFVLRATFGTSFQLGFHFVQPKRTCGNICSERFIFLLRNILNFAPSNFYLNATVRGLYSAQTGIAMYSNARTFSRLLSESFSTLYLAFHIKRFCFTTATTSASWVSQSFSETMK